MKARRILDEWNGYRERVMPAEAGTTQVQETRRAFYGGARSMIALMLLGLDPGSADVVTPEDLDAMDGWTEELRQFVVDITEGRA